tara:strand:- start:3329 stop:4186 length:858 start_codon:yes stop_codon:yes gene_type:complete
MSEHTEVLDNSIKNFESVAADTSKSLENRVAELIMSGDTSRTSIVGAYETVANIAAQNATSLTNISANTVLSQTEAGIGSGNVPEDNSVETLLVEDARGTIKQSIMNHAETVTSLVIAGTLTGIAADALANQARGSVSGLMMSTSDPVTTALQTRFAKMATDPNRNPEEYRNLRKQIQDRLPGITTAGSLSDTLRGMAESVVMRFDGAFTANRGQRLGITKWTYSGGVVENTRPWCSDLDGQTLDEDEINDLWGEDWAGKSGDNPFVDRGGYNCRHYWEPVQEEE